MSSLRETEPIDYTNLETISKEVEGLKKPLKNITGPLLMLPENRLKKPLRLLLKFTRYIKTMINKIILASKVVSRKKY